MKHSDNDDIKVLVFDDQSEQYKSVSEVLRGMVGYQVRFFDDQSKAIENVIYFRPDVIVFDGLRGFKSLVKIREALVKVIGENVPTLIVGTDFNRSDLTRYQKKAPIQILKKPFHELELVDRVNSLAALKTGTPFESENSTNGSLFEKILGLACLLWPLGLVAHHSLESVFDIATVFGLYLSALTSDMIFKTWLVVPMIGLSLLSDVSWRRWVFYPGLGLALYWQMTYEAYSWPYLTQNTHLFSDGLLFICMLYGLYRLDYSLLFKFWAKQSKQDARQFPRFGLNVPCTVNVRKTQKQLSGEILNISQEGAFIKTKRTFDRGEKVDLIVEAPLIRFIAESEVVHLKIDRAGEGESIKGYGLKFSGFKRGGQKEFKRLLEGLKHLPEPMDEAS